LLEKLLFESADFQDLHLFKEKLQKTTFLVLL